MRFLEEHRRRPAALADHLPWAALVAQGVVLNKDGSFTTGFRFRGPDLESSTEDELMAVRARLNNALKRLGTGWCLHMEARRREAAPYPESAFDLDVAWLLDEERRSRFEAGDPAFETDFRLALTWLPPADETRRMERWLFDGLAKGGADWRQALAVFTREAATTLDLLSDALPEIAPLDDTDLLTWLHDCVSPRSFPVAAPESPMYLDAWLADADLSGGIAPRLGDRWLKVVSVRGLPSVTRPGLLDALGALPFPYRWAARWIGLDKPEAEREIVKLRKRWFAKRIFDDTESPSDERHEEEADAFARNALLPAVQWDLAVSRFSRTEKAVLTDAKRFGVGPAVIAGRVRREAGDYTVLRSLVGAGEVRRQFGL